MDVIHVCSRNAVATNCMRDYRHNTMQLHGSKPSILLTHRYTRMDVKQLILMHANDVPFLNFASI